MEPLLLALRRTSVDLVLAVAAGAGAAVAAMQLVRARRRAARVRGLASRAAALGTGAGGATGPAHAGSDEVAALARALHAAEARLAEERASRERFLARALEEVQRPLSLLATSLDLALRRRPEVPELSAALRDAQHEAERIARLAGRIAQLQGVAGSVRLVPLDLAVLARAAWQLGQPAAARKGVTLALDAPGPAPVAGDEPLLAQALDELLANALAVTRAGGSITLAVAREGAVVRATVRDDGPGLPPERRALVFEPFGRGAQGWSAAGLGLALVREIARGHGGTAALGEAVRGTAIVLELPAG